MKLLDLALPSVFFKKIILKRPLKKVSRLRLRLSVSAQAKNLYCDLDVYRSLS
jgi:hypothetical protein